MSKFKVGDHVQTNDLHSKRFGTAASGVIASLDDNERYIELESGQWFCCDELEPMPMNKVEGADMVNHPPHYTQGDIECIDAIKAALTPDEFRGYCKGAAHKYIWRERHKGGDESLKKAVWYLNKATEENQHG